MQLSTGNVKADINVTPLVDVVLVLLIIFMVVTPMLQRGEAVTLPKTLNPAKIKEAFDRNPGSTIVIKADGRLTFGDVKKTMISIKDAGYQQVGLITEKKEKT